MSCYTAIVADRSDWPEPITIVSFSHVWKYLKGGLVTQFWLRSCDFSWGVREKVCLYLKIEGQDCHVFP